jgi:uncharacterized protein YecT (DUF1311 family)
MIDQIVLAVVSAVLGGAGVLCMRYLRKDHITEGLAQMDAALSLKKRMRDEGFNEEQIASVVRMASRRSLPLEKAVEKAADEDFAELNRAKSQAEINMEAGRYYERADLDMRQAYARVEESIKLQRLEKLREVQKAWESYRDASGDLLAMLQGSMWGSVATLAMAKITKRRTEDLKNEREIL